MEADHPINRIDELLPRNRRLPEISVQAARAGRAAIVPRLPLFRQGCMLYELILTTPELWWRP